MLSHTCGLGWLSVTTLLHPHSDIESIAFQPASDTTTLPVVEAFPSVEVGRCGFIQGFVLWGPGLALAAKHCVSLELMATSISQAG